MYRRLFSVGALGVLLSFPVKPSVAATTFTKADIKATADLGSVTFSYELDTAPGSDGGNYNIQLFIQNIETGQYVLVSPTDEKSAPLKLAIFPDGTVNKGTFTVPLAPGHYGVGRAVLFEAGSNFAKTVAEVGIKQLNLVVLTKQQRIVSPTVEVDPTHLAVPGFDGKLHVPFTIKFPRGFDVPGGYFWVMAKGSGGFKQAAMPLKNTMYGTNSADDYGLLSGEFVMDMPTKVGVYNLEVGLFDSAWKQYQWLFPGVDFEYGDWVVKADPANYPSIQTALKKGKAPFFIAGNFGNAIYSIGSAANDSPSYYKLIRATTGAKILRENFHPDLYRTSVLYRHKVQQTVENMLSAGVVPCIAPQDMPSGKDLAAQEAALVALDVQLAQDFTGKPVIIDILNEPHQYKTWASWKPVATRAAHAVKIADPKAFVVVDAEGYAEDMTGASASPLAPGLVDLYGWHSYHAGPSQLASKAGKGIKIWLQEYHNASVEFHTALERIPNLQGVAAWAWTTPGQDGLNLVQSVDGAQINFTSDGQSLVQYYKIWLAGGTLADPVKK